MYILISLGSFTGGYIMKLLGAQTMSGWWFIGTIIGMIAGVYVFIKMGQWGQ